MVWMQSHLLKCVLVISVGFLGACGDVGAPAGSSAGASPASAAATKWKDGVRFTIDGPAFGGPAVFVVPGDHERLFRHVTDGMFNVTFQPRDPLKAPVMSEDGKHKLDLLMFGTEPAGKGEFTESSRVSEFTVSISANVGTPQSEGLDASFDYPQGVRQPVRLAVEHYDTRSDTGGAAGHFTATLQRSNIDSTTEAYQAKGEFKVKK